MRVIVGVGNFGAVRTTNGRPLHAKTNSLSPWLPSYDKVTYFTSAGDILTDWLGLVWVRFGVLETFRAEGVGTRPLHAVMEELDLDWILTNLLLLIPIMPNCHLGVLAAS